MQLELYADVQGADRTALEDQVRSVLKEALRAAPGVVASAGVHFSRSFGLDALGPERCMLEVRLRSGDTLVWFSHGFTPLTAFNRAASELRRCAAHLRQLAQAVDSRSESEA